MSTFRNWMYENRCGVGGMMTVEFVDGVQNFLNFAFSSPGLDTQISCPCKGCKNWREHDRETITEHLYKRGFVSDYRIWIYHGESFENYGCNYKESSSLPEVDANLFSHRDMVEDAFPQFLNNDKMQWEEPNGEAKAFYDLLTKADQPVYEGHEKSLLQWVTEIMNFKTTFNPSQAGMDYFIRSCRAMAPAALREQIPDNYAQVKNIISKLGLGVIKYDVCVNDCFLYYKEGESLRSCPICKEPRYKLKKNEQEKDTAQKKLWYFPIIRRLQRLFMSRKTAEHMTWHKKCEPESDKIVHPAGAKAWKHFDRNYPEYAAEPRNVRLGISTDGFNPFKGTGTQYSCWPVFVTPYNLPPDLCMNQEFIFLSLLISGPNSPRVNIDVMLRPLVDDLKILWNDGVITWDCVRQENFVMRANALWTISDFPAYGMLSGWSTHGRLACPYCMEEIESFRLENGGKPSWFDCHRCFLPRNHPHRKNRSNFYAGQEVNEKRRERKDPAEMKEIIDSLPQVTFGIHYKEIPGFGDSHNWTKKSIWYELPYWSTLLIRHNLDVMHGEKNFFDNIFNTVMDVPCRTKDNRKARLDLELYTTRNKLFLTGQNNTKPKATYTLTHEQRKSVCEWVKGLEFPDAHASHIGNCVNLKTNKISGMKSHDCHVFMQRLLPIAFKEFLPEPIWNALTEVSNCFRALCTSEIRASDMEKLQKTVVETLCKLEMIFPPAFFDSMEHLLVHLPYEALVGGPVFYRWMYAFERKMFILKNMVKNKSRVEGSICEAYLITEITNFCSFYFGQEIDTTTRRPKRNEEEWTRQFEGQFDIFIPKGRPMGASTTRRMDETEWSSAILYILMNCEEAVPYISSFESQLPKNMSENDREFARVNQLVPWFEQLALYGELSESQLSILFRGGDRVVKKYKGYIVNGLRFHTEAHGQNRKTMNSGVRMKAQNSEGEPINFYGMLQEIIELTFLYPGYPEQVIHLFKCDWYDSVNVHKKYGLVEIDPKSKLVTTEPFMLASQANQVYYARFPKEKGRIRKEMWAVCPIRARHIIDVSAVSSQIDQEPQPSSEYYQEAEPPLLHNLVNDLSELNIRIELVHNGVPEVEAREEDVEELQGESEEDDVE